ncbi:fimbrial protein [Enterobacter asburiae]|uniref:fimbrial protein n=1 Tax=Enterobacter asburiae TaxID=61645 RepID=UPI001CC32ECA|nr:fimbrial protein [Enterobacter asburiae]MDE4034262.1 fimbrial protein [Enterobacter asburiae]MDE4066925.1 fimbrial protein [Enterobacter asburiae]MDE4070723.1 fimbrial protein [Enterobacter asburiae]
MSRVFYWLGLIALMPPAYAMENNLQISGQLVAEPCTLSAASSDITLDFGNLVSKYFYQTSRTPGEPFAIVLTECDTALGSSATVTFKGTESVALPGLLVPDDGDTHGIAFGIETDDETPRPLALNQASPVYTLANGTNTLALRGYVQAEPDAIAAHSLTAGAFVATATFQIDYP